MPQYDSPGVYIEEVPSGFRPIEAVGSTTAAFLGVATKAGAPLVTPTRIDTWSAFVDAFVDPAAKLPDLAKAVWGFLRNGGRTCYVVHLGNRALSDGLAELEKVDEVAMVAAPGMTGPADHGAVLDHCEKMRDRVAILDAAPDAKVDELCQAAVVEGVKKAKPKGDGDVAAPVAVQGRRPRKSDGGFGTVYFPWLVMAHPFDAKADPIEAPPSGHVAGIWARNDYHRGVHKTPANEVVGAAVGVTRRLSREDQAKLNPNGVNCIRVFDRQGVLVWGGRTLDDAASEYRYVAVRRFVNMVEKSLERALQWAVFEANAQPLWKALTRDVSAFLTTLWRQGMLKGATPEQAFFVACNEETNPPDVVAAGQVVVTVGLSVIRPAEFVIVRVSQQSGLESTDTKNA